MRDLETLLRETLADRADSVVASGELSAPVRARARARRNRHKSALGVLAALLVVAGVAGVALRDSDEVGVAVRPGPTPTVFTGTPLPETYVFVDGKFYDLSSGVAREIYGPAPGPRASAAPVVTGTGLLFGDDRGNLWFTPDQGEPRLIDASVVGYAVASDRVTLAWSTVSADGSASIITRAQLPRLDERSTVVVDSVARPVDFAGTVLMVHTGDGAASGVAVWPYGADRVTPLADLRSVAATSDGRAVVTSDDGICFNRLVSVRANGTVDDGPDLGCGLFSFDATLTRVDPFNRTVSFLASGTGGVLSSMALGGRGEPSQVVSKPREALVLVRIDEGHYDLRRCVAREAQCTDAWSFDLGPRDPGAMVVSLIERR